MAQRHPDSAVGSLVWRRCPQYAERRGLKASPQAREVGDSKREKPEEIEQPLNNRAKAIITGQVITVDGGLTITF